MEKKGRKKLKPLDHQQVNMKKPLGRSTTITERGVSKRKKTYKISFKPGNTRRSFKTGNTNVTSLATLRTMIAPIKRGKTKMPSTAKSTKSLLLLKRPEQIYRKHNMPPENTEAIKNNSFMENLDCGVAELSKFYSELSQLTNILNTA